jgi:hypothetical protein
MKKQNAIILIVIAIMLSTSACGTVTISSHSGRRIEGNGVLTEESRDVGNFNEIELAGIGSVYVEFGDETSLVIEAEENLMDYIETRIFGQKLVIRLEDDYSYDPTEDINFYLTVVELEGVSISGLGNMSLPEIETDRFEIGISGAGDVTIDALYADRLYADLSGLGDVDILGGEVEIQDVNISGSGTYSSKDMACREADVSVSGLGSATVTVSEYLDASISGAGDIDYYGSPEVDMNITGLGSLHAHDD